jgi:hypothetical protein
MTRTVARGGLLAILLALGARPAGASGTSELGGSLTSMTRQHRVALNEAYGFLGTAHEIRRLVDAGELVAVEGNADYGVSPQVVHRYARPEVRRFLERLSAGYHAATGERLVVTSLVRPESEQPANAHRLSVHPAGMAVDLRVSAKGESRAWLERTLLGLEQAGVLDVTREHRPPHYHVAVFPAAYTAYADRRDAASAARAEQALGVRAERAARAAVLAAPTVVTPVSAPEPQPTVATVATAGVGGDVQRHGVLALLLGVGLSAGGALAAARWLRRAVVPAESLPQGR